MKNYSQTNTKNKALFINKKFIDFIKYLHTEYQPRNGKSHWIFVINQNDEDYAIEYDPKKEQIEIL